MKENDLDPLEILLNRLRGGRPAEEDPFRVSPEIFYLTGRCMVYWNRIEFEAEACIAMLLMPRSISVTSALTDKLPPQSKLKALAHMGHEEPCIAGAVNDQLQGAVAAVIKLADQRNWVAHGRWQHTSESGEPCSARVFANFQKNNTLSDLRQLERKLADALWRIGEVRRIISYCISTR